MSYRIKSHIEEVIGLLWGLLATQTTGIIYWISAFMAGFSLAGALVLAIKGMKSAKPQTQESNK